MYRITGVSLIFYAVVHPAAMALAWFMAPGTAVMEPAAGLLPAMLGAFSLRMLPWGIFFAASGGIVGYYWDAFRNADENKTRLIAELREALAQVRELSGLIPICCGCKKIRNDKGYWEQVERYISSHSEARFSHGICPDCEKRLYPELLAAENDTGPGAPGKGSPGGEADAGGN